MEDVGILSDHFLYFWGIGNFFPVFVPTYVVPKKSGPTRAL
jgi:hypothetical protein